MPGVLAIMGSGERIGPLMAADLIDGYLLMIHPLVLGSEPCLFPEKVDVSLQLIDRTYAAERCAVGTREE